MLQVVYGTDEIMVRTTALDFFASPGTVRIEAGNFVPGQLKTLAQGNSLFGEKTEYLLDTPSDNQAFFEEVLAEAATLADSEHLFVVIDKGLLAADKKVLAKHAASMVEYKKPTESSFNQFAITDAVASRDKRQAWLLVQEAWQNHIATEEIIGLVWWQLKTMRLAACTQTAAEAGMKDYPYRKAKSALQNFPLTLVEARARSLTKLYHDARWGKGDLNQLFEIWVLSL
jgi:DNA polymerase III delta subunit